jgi:hypothetical protein
MLEDMLQMQQFVAIDIGWKPVIYFLLENSVSKLEQI